MQMLSRSAGILDVHADLAGALPAERVEDEHAELPLPAVFTRSATVASAPDEISFVDQCTTS